MKARKNSKVNNETGAEIRYHGAENNVHGFHQCKRGAGSVYQKKGVSGEIRKRGKRRDAGKETSENEAA